MFKEMSAKMPLGPSPGWHCSPVLVGIKKLVTVFPHYNLVVCKSSVVFPPQKLIVANATTSHICEPFHGFSSFRRPLFWRSGKFANRWWCQCDGTLKGRSFGREPLSRVDQRCFDEIIWPWKFVGTTRPMPSHAKTKKTEDSEWGHHFEVSGETCWDL